MLIASWQFNPSLWPTLAVFLVLPLFLSLGFWQLDRVEQKRVLSHKFEASQGAKEISLNRENALRNNHDKLNWRKVAIDGMFSREINILLDNQVKRGTAGYFVYTPFKLKELDVWVLVNRGWLPLGDSRDNLPDIKTKEGMLQITGSVKSPPKTGILLAENIMQHLGEGIVRVQKLELESIEKVSGFKLLPYIVRLDHKSPAGFTRQWQAPGYGEEKHLAYAFQWFVMATAVFLIYLFLNIKRVK